MAAAGDSGGGTAGRVIIGRVSGIYGVAGWVKVFSYTRPKENIFNYSPWQVASRDGWREYRLREGKVHGKGLIASLEDIADRDAAREIMGGDIAIRRDQLPPLPEGEYYWCDLIGCRVVNLEGKELGEVTEIRETGANDVLIVEGRARHLVPLVLDKVVREVDLEQGRLLVDWHGD